jgi:hypothetical protein
VFASKSFSTKSFSPKSWRGVARVATQLHEVDFESPLWWKRRPKRIAEDEARAVLKKAATVIRAVAKDHAEQGLPQAQRRGQARQIIAPLIEQMPGFDWRPMYELAYSQALTTAILARFRDIDSLRRLRDDELALLLLI